MTSGCNKHQIKIFLCFYVMFMFMLSARQIRADRHQSINQWTITTATVHILARFLYILYQWKQE